MKYLMVFCFVLLAVVVYVGAEDEKEEYCSEEFKKILEGKCGAAKCNKNSTIMTGISCPLLNCAGDIERYEKEDLNKPFPECCETVICKE